MATTAPQFEATQTPKTTYRAAVVHDFSGPLTSSRSRCRTRARTGAREGRGVRPVPHRHPRRPRRLAGQALPAVHPRPRGRRHRHRARLGRD